MIIRYVFCLLFFISSVNIIAQVKLTISQIQGDQVSSPYLGQFVEVDSVIVTATGANGFFLQSRTGHDDQNEFTSEGLFVYWNSNTPTPLVGDLINIKSVVQEYEGETELTSSNTQIQVYASGQALPAPIVLDATFPSDQFSTIPELERVEGMRVTFNNGTICSPGTSYQEAGFYLNQRPFREPGIITPGINGLPVWDNNPELIFFDSQFSGNNNARFATGMKLNATGVLSVKDDHYLFRAVDYELTGNLVDRRARPREAQEFTVGCLNALFLDSDATPDNIIHRQQIAIYILEGMKAPNIVAVQEVENLAAMQDVANRINDMDPSVEYEVYLEKMPGSSINLGYFVDASIVDVAIFQLGTDEDLSIGGRMHDRPPFLLTGSLSTAPPTPIQIINVHLKSLIGITGGNSTAVRIKRHEAAISVANMVRERQHQNLLVLGDFNAFQFSDGYVDVVNQISGQPSLGAERPVVPIVSPPLINLTETVAKEDRYSYVFRGNAQVLDHCLSNDLEGLTFKELQFIRGNADNPELYVNNPTTPQFSSDHDGFVVYFEVKEPLINVGTVELEKEKPNQIIVANPYQRGEAISFTAAKRGDYNYRLWNQSGQLIFSEHLGEIGKEEIHQFSVDAFPSSGIYYLEVFSHDSFAIESLIISW